MPLRSAARTTLVPQVIEQLTSQIDSGEWRVGTRIPPEPQLALALGVGRNTLREAVNALVHAGLLERRQGSGTYVVAATELAGAVGRRVAAAHLAEVAEVRRALEVEAGRLAALRRTDADLDALDAALGAREAAWTAGDPGAFVDADLDLHRCVFTAAHNSILADLYDHVTEAVRASLADAVGETLSPETYIDHARLVAAIRGGDPIAAAAESASYFEGNPRR
jgi:DNA-binding FadR family transcriptional regulator